jgi:type I restriction enzyme S subunit
MLMLKELGTIHTGSTPKTNDESLFGGDVPFVTPGDLDVVSSIQSTPRTLTEAGVKTADLLPAESVLVCCIGSLGKIGFAGRPVVTNQQINAVVFNPLKVHARYGFFACRMLKPQLELMAPATTVPIVNKSRFSELKIPVPPLEEQRRIATILDQAETLRTQRRQALDYLDTLTQSLFLDMFGDPVTNPKGWTTQSLQKVCDPINDCPHSTPEWTDSGEICLRTSNLTIGGWNWSDTRYVSEATFHERSKRGYLASGDIVLSREGTVGIAAIVQDGMKLCMGQRLVQVRPLPGALEPEYLLRHLLYVLSPSRISQLMVGSTSQHLNVKELRALRIPIPTLSLQQTFATRIQAIEALKATHRTALAELDALFASLQQRAFAGEL